MKLLALSCLVSLSVAAQTLPPEAEKVVAAYEKSANAIREKAEKETQPHLDKAIAALQALQDSYCQQKKLDSGTHSGAARHSSRPGRAVGASVGHRANVSVRGDGLDERERVGHRGVHV